MYTMLRIGLLTSVGAVTVQLEAAAPAIPKLWDEQALARMTLPPVRPEGQIVYVSSEYFYSMPSIDMYKAYPVYHPDREPRGYLEWLKRREPVVAFDPSKLRTDADWIGRTKRRSTNCGRRFPPHSTKHDAHQLAPMMT